MLFSTSFFFFLVGSFNPIVSSTNTESQGIESLLQSYDKHELPLPYENVVKVSVYIQQAALVFDDNYSYMQLQMFLRQKWQDPRLNFGEVWSSTMRLPYRFSDKLWKPDLYIDNAASFEVSTAVEDNGIFYVYPSGDILMSIGVKVKTYCSLYLSNFPFDVQTCLVSIKSYAHADDLLLFTWDNEISPAVFSSDVQIHEFSIFNLTTDTRERYFTTGVYSELQLAVVFGRSVSHYVVLYFFPATVLVFVSWIAMWIPKDKVTARVVIGVSTLKGILVLCHLGKSASGRRSYLTKTDTYLFLCSFYIFFTMIVALSQCLCCTKCCSRNKEQENDSVDGSAVHEKRSICGMVVLILIPVSFVGTFFLYLYSVMV